MEAAGTSILMRHVAIDQKKLQAIVDYADECVNSGGSGGGIGWQRFARLHYGWENAARAQCLHCAATAPSLDAGHTSM